MRWRIRWRRGRSGTKNGCGPRQCRWIRGVILSANAASARRAASPARTGEASATSRISARSPLQYSTISQPAAMAAPRGSPSDPDRACIDMSSLINRPLNPIEPRITSLTIIAEVVAGATGSMALNTTCAVMPSGRPASGRKASKSLPSRVSRSVSTTGSARWLSAVARPWPGRCLTTGRTPPFSSPSAAAACKCRDLSGRVAVGTVADHRIGCGNRHIGDRQAIHVDPDRAQIGRHQPRAKRGRGKRLRPVHLIQPRRKRRPADRPANAAARAAARARLPDRPAPAHRVRRSRGTHRSAAGPDPGFRYCA